MVEIGVSCTQDYESKMHIWKHFMEREEHQEKQMNIRITSGDFP